MEDNISKVQSWEVSDPPWERVEPLIPKPNRDPNKKSTRKPGGGRKPMPARQIFEAIMYLMAYRLPMESTAQGAVWEP